MNLFSVVFFTILSNNIISILILGVIHVIQGIEFPLFSIDVSCDQI